MTQSIVVSIITAFFSFTGMLWGFILAAICIEELQLMHDKIIKTKLLMAILTSTTLFHISTQIYSTQIFPNKSVISIIFFILGIMVLIFGLKLQESKLEHLNFIPITIAYITIIIYQIPKNQFLLLASTVLIYFFMIGISIHARFLGIKPKNHKNIQKAKSKKKTNQ